MANEEEINNTFDEVNATIDIPTRQLNRELFRALIVQIVSNFTGHAFPMTFGGLVPDAEIAEQIVDMFRGQYGHRLWPSIFHPEDKYGEYEGEEQQKIRKSLVWYVRCIMGSQGHGPTQARRTQSEPDLRRARGHRARVGVLRNDSCEQRLREEPLPWMKQNLNHEEQRRFKRYREAERFLPANDDGLDQYNNTASGQEMQLPIRTQQNILQPSCSDVEDTLNYESDDSTADEPEARCPFCWTWFHGFTALRNHCEKRQCEKLEFAEEGETSGR